MLLVSQPKYLLIKLAAPGAGNMNIGVSCLDYSIRKEVSEGHSVVIYVSVSVSVMD
jgi:hypothetical protein